MAGRVIEVFVHDGNRSDDYFNDCIGRLGRKARDWRAYIREVRQLARACSWRLSSGDCVPELRWLRVTRGYLDHCKQQAERKQGHQRFGTELRHYCASDAPTYSTVVVALVLRQSRNGGCGSLVEIGGFSYQEHGDHCARMAWFTALTSNGMIAPSYWIDPKTAGRLR